MPGTWTLTWTYFWIHNTHTQKKKRGAAPRVQPARARNPTVIKPCLRMPLIHTSSLMMSDGRRPLPSSGGISEPRRLGGPLPGANEPLRSGSRITSILGASMVGALISGTFGPSWWRGKRGDRVSNTRLLMLMLKTVEHHNIEEELQKFDRLTRLL